MLIDTEILSVITAMALVVYATRAGGYLLGLQLRHIGWIRPMLQTLPGCAFMAILAPAAWRGSIIETAALFCVVAIMWWRENVVVASLVGVGVLLFGEQWLAGFVGY